MTRQEAIDEAVRRVERRSSMEFRYIAREGFCGCGMCSSVISEIHWEFNRIKTVQ
jgi:hypothetical protein